MPIIELAIEDRLKDIQGIEKRPLRNQDSDLRDAMFTFSLQYLKPITNGTVPGTGVNSGLRSKLSRSLLDLYIEAHYNGEDITMAYSAKRLRKYLEILHLFEHIPYNHLRIENDLASALTSFTNSYGLSLPWVNFYSIMSSEKNMLVSSISRLEETLKKNGNLSSRTKLLEVAKKHVELLGIDGDIYLHK